MDKEKYTTISVRKEFYEKLKEYCDSKGLVKGRFIEITCLKVIDRKGKK